MANPTGCKAKQRRMAWFRPIAAGRPLSRAIGKSAPARARQDKWPSPPRGGPPRGGTELGLQRIRPGRFLPRGSPPSHAAEAGPFLAFSFAQGLASSRAVAILYFLRRIAGHRGVAQHGRALRSGRKGRWFKSSRPDIVKGRTVRFGLLQCREDAEGSFVPAKRTREWIPSSRGRLRSSRRRGEKESRLP